jgi:hypothetical protein
MVARKRCDVKGCKTDMYVRIDGEALCQKCYEQKYHPQRSVCNCGNPAKVMIDDVLYCWKCYCKLRGNKYLGYKDEK